MKMLVLCWLMFLSAPLWAQDQLPPPPTDEQHEQAKAYLEELKALYLKSEINSFTAQVRLRNSKNAALKRFSDAMEVSYSWESPDLEEVEVTGLLEKLADLVRPALKNVWKDVLGQTLFSEIKENRLLLQEQEKEMILFVFAPTGLLGRMRIDKELKLILSFQWETKEVIEPGYSLEKGKLRLNEKLIKRKTKDNQEVFIASYGYSTFLKVGQHVLPHKLLIETKTDLMELLLQYKTINKEKAPPPEADLEMVKALVKTFKEKYSKWTAPEKLKALKELEETKHKLAAQMIAKLALKDKNLEIRKEAANALGAMKCREILSSLLKAYKSNSKNLDVYLAIIKALGDIGDPKAVSALSKDMWNQKRGQDGIRAAQAKIDALGKIRSKKSVDALIDMVYVAERWVMAALALNLRSSLKALTNQDFGFDREQWKSWWKKNRSKFKLEED